MVLSLASPPKAPPLQTSAKEVHSDAGGEFFRPKKVPRFDKNLLRVQLQSFKEFGGSNSALNEEPPPTPTRKKPIVPRVQEPEPSVPSIAFQGPSPPPSAGTTPGTTPRGSNTPESQPKSNHLHIPNARPPKRPEPPDAEPAQVVFSLAKPADSLRRSDESDPSMSSAFNFNAGGGTSTQELVPRNASANDVNGEVKERRISAAEAVHTHFTQLQKMPSSHEFRPPVVHKSSSHQKDSLALPSLEDLNGFHGKPTKQNRPISEAPSFCRLSDNDMQINYKNGSVLTIDAPDENDELELEDDVSDAAAKRRMLWKAIKAQKTSIKVFCLTIVTLIAVLIIVFTHHGEHTSRLFTVSSGEPRLVSVNRDFYSAYLHMRIRGALEGMVNPESHPFNETEGLIRLTLCTVHGDSAPEKHADVDQNVVDECLENHLSDSMYIQTSEQTGHNANLEMFLHKYKVKLNRWKDDYHPFVAVEASNNTQLSVELSVHDEGTHGSLEVVVALLILIFLYAMIASEMIHRTAAAFVCALMAIAALHVLKGQGPSMEILVEWIDWETLLLLFGMMIMVAIFSESGFFDYAAVLCCKVAGKRKWTLIFVLCFTSAFISAFLDNVTTVLLMTPVTIKICEALNYNPVPILIAIVLTSNIGGAATAIGDPPNVLIVSNKEMQNEGVNFMMFTMHVAGGAAFCFILGFAMIFFLYRNADLAHIHDPEVQRLHQTINLWTRYANRIPSVTREENMIKMMIRKEVGKLKKTLHEQKRAPPREARDWKEELKKLEETSKIRDMWLLGKASLTLLGVVLLFFLQSTPIVHAPLGTIALGGAVLLIVLANEEDIEHVFEKVEWTTLVFFGSLFVLMEALTELHLLDFIGDYTIQIIASFNEEIRLPVALVLILWVSALSSAFIDNIPFTQAMIPVVIQLGESDPSLPLLPLVWALALGACLGGNGTLIGASANLVCAATANQKGYKITFVDFFKTGFPVMLMTIVGATIYLFVCHVAFSWH